MSCPFPHDRNVILASQPVAWLLAAACRGRALVRIPAVGAVVSDPDLAQAICQRDEDFTKNGKGSVASIVTQALGPVALTNMDGEEHRALRARLTTILTPAYAAEIVQEVCAAPLSALSADLEAGRTVDLVRFMRALAGRITLHMMGARSSDLAQGEAVVAAGEELASYLRLTLRPLTPAKAAAATAACERLVAHARVAWHDGGGPSCSMVRKLHELGLTFEEARGLLAILFLGGAQTTAGALPRIVGLLVDGGMWRTLREHPERVGAAIDEGIRLTTPIPATVRIAARDTEVAGHRFRKEERVVLLTYNLARDARAFPRPDELVLERENDARMRNLGFGSGPHFCPGFALAQRELTAVLEALLVPPGQLVIVGRRAARRVLLPRYERMDVRSAA
jgi:cytochrome P450